MPGHNWTDQEIAALVYWKNCGCSWAYIAELMLEEYGFTVSKMALKRQYYNHRFDR